MRIHLHVVLEYEQNNDDLGGVSADSVCRYMAMRCETEAEQEFSVPGLSLTGVVISVEEEDEPCPTAPGTEEQSSG